MRRVCATIVAVGKHWVSHNLCACVCVCVCICSLRYSACNVHAQYCHLWPVWLYNIFPLYLINGTIFGGGEKKLLNTKCVFWLSLQILSATFLTLRLHERDKTKRTSVSMWSTLYSRLILIKLEFSRQVLEKSSKIKFHEISSIGNRVVVCGRTDGRTDGQTWRS